MTVRETPFVRWWRDLDRCLAWLGLEPATIGEGIAHSPATPAAAAQCIRVARWHEQTHPAS